MHRVAKKTRLLFISNLLIINLFAQVDHWETAIYATDDWAFRLGDSEPPSDWTTVNFNDTNWQTGEGGIGYGDGDDNTIIVPVTSLYIRHTFEVFDLSKIELAALHADYDDAFVAYLNGVEIARSNIGGTPPMYNTGAANLHEAMMYQGQLPEIYLLPKNQLETTLTNGNNVLAIQIHNFDGTNSSDLSSNFFLSFAINDASSDYGDTPAWFISPGFTTHLPIVKINSWGAYIPDEPSIPAEIGIIWHGDGMMNSSLDTPNEFFGDISIERRGQSSLGVFPKNGFGFETKDESGDDLDVSFLNFPEEEDWILHGPYSDKTLIRNVLTMHLAQGVEQYASRTRLVELVINEQYEGVYVLMEKIKQDKNRVDIANLKEEDIEGDELTGGYVFKIDKDEPDWFSQFDMVNNPGGKLQFQHVSPKAAKIQPEQAAYIKSYVDSFELAIASPNWNFGGKRYDEYIDLTSFAEHFIISELGKNVDAYRISSYFYKKKNSDGGKVFAGPIWDFNLAWGNANYCEGAITEGWIYDFHCGNGNPFWWERMFQDSVFRNVLKCRWETLRQGPLALDSIHAFIDEKENLLKDVVDRNFERWPILNEYVWPNPVVTGAFSLEIVYLENWIAERIEWMDDNIIGECSPVLDVKELVSDFVKIYPNPASNRLTVQIPRTASLPITIYIADITGRLMKSIETETTSTSITLATNELPEGIYFCTVKIGQQQWTEKVSIIR